jgi:uncharacterized repeat protein (TIGR01451 family)
MKSRHLPSRRLMAWSLLGISLGIAPGCGLSSGLRREPDHVYSDSTPPMLQQQPGVQPLPARAHYPDENATMSAVGSAAQPDGVVRLGGDQQSSSPHEFHQTTVASSNTKSAGQASSKHSDFILASYQPEDLNSSRPGEPIFTQAEPRLETGENGVPRNKMETIAPAPLADLFPDEYVFDGGDRDLSAAMHTNRSGLDTEDTVAAFADHTGERRTTASNRVAVYAPRFGSVRTVTGLVADVKVDKAVGAKDNITIGNLKTGNAPHENVHDTSLSGLETRDRVDGMKGAIPPMQNKRMEIAGQNRKVDEGHEGRDVKSPGIFHRKDGIEVAEQMRNAITWTRDQFPVITATTTNASEISAKFKVQQTIGVKDERETRGNVRIVKLADRDEARSGDTITFTINFQNTGDFDVYDVSIVDNLTPRLAYVSGSAEIDEKHPGEVSVEPNGEGSEILTFKLDKPLKGHASGTITFEAVVR